MKKIIAIAKKEIGSYFRSPVAYIIFVLTTVVFNILFFAIIDENREASLVDVFKAMEFMFIVFMPMLTMKIFSEERSGGTMEFLMTAPVKNTEIVLGKYFGSLFFYTILIAVNLVYFVIIEFFGTPDRLAILAGYIGIWLEGALFISIGMLTSSWTKNQIVSAISSYVILFLLYSSMIFVKYFDGMAGEIIKYVSTYTHAENFFSGVIAIEDLVYYLCGIIVMIVLTRISIENRS